MRNARSAKNLRSLREKYHLDESSHRRCPVREDIEDVGLALDRRADHLD